MKAEIIIIGVAAISCGSMSAFVARVKGYSTVAWFAIGFFLTLPAVIAIAGAPMARDRYVEGTGDEQGEHETVTAYMDRMKAKEAKQ